MTDEEREQSAEGYDPYEYVPDRIDLITASGLEQLHDALAERNKAKLRSVAVEEQAVLLWNLVEKGTIDLNVTGSNQEARE